MRLSWIFPTSKRGWFWLMMRMTFLIVIPIVLLLRYMIDMPGKSYHGSVALLTTAEQTVADRMLTHVRVIASEEHNTKHPKALADAAKYIEVQLAEISNQQSVGCAMRTE